jgi:hypothetical protein
MINMCVSENIANIVSRIMMTVNKSQTDYAPIVELFAIALDALEMI